MLLTSVIRLIHRIKFRAFDVLTTKTSRNLFFLYVKLIHLYNFNHSNMILILMRDNPCFLKIEIRFDSKIKTFIIKDKDL